MVGWNTWFWFYGYEHHIIFEIYTIRKHFASFQFDHPWCWLAAEVSLPSTHRAVWFALFFMKIIIILTFRWIQSFRNAQENEKKLHYFKLALYFSDIHFIHRWKSRLDLSTWNDRICWVMKTCPTIKVAKCIYNELKCYWSSTCWAWYFFKDKFHLSSGIVDTRYYNYAKEKWE